MMNLRSLSLLFAVVCGMCTAEPAAVAAAAPEPESVAPRQEYPFFRHALYPAWSQMTMQQAVVDTRAAIAETRERLAAIAAVTPETATFDNTFLAWYKADENLKLLTNYLYHLHTATGDPAIQHAMYDIQSEIMSYRAEGLHAARIAEVLREAAQVRLSAEGVLKEITTVQ